MPFRRACAFRSSDLARKIRDLSQPETSLARGAQRPHWHFPQPLRTVASMADADDDQGKVQ
ncbi:hypothetical protein AY599_25270 [Leptolyngbya valderiana BDU 20041]|nr:hypothetical protein AY599_25270 [Leptolyngbya valderiana BDU 20041]